MYLIYGYKRGTFWPFIPTGDGQERDNAAELRLKNELEGSCRSSPSSSAGSGSSARRSIQAAGARSRESDVSVPEPEAGLIVGLPSGAFVACDVPGGCRGSGRPRSSARASPRASGHSAG